jgi:ATP phosphoribosyltransferase regulatory subunit HisZ
MDEASLEGALNELVKQFGGSTDANHQKLADLAKQAEANRKELQKSINTLQELLDYLRVCIKYQAFDLEATRRENAYLRKLLEESNRDDK